MEAKYFAGGPLPNAEVNWLVGTTPTNYSPPGWSDFTFGIWQPWWWYYIDYESGGIGPSTGESTYETFTGTTDSNGEQDAVLEPLLELGVEGADQLGEALDELEAGALGRLTHPAVDVADQKHRRHDVRQADPAGVRPECRRGTAPGRAV